MIPDGASFATRIPMDGRWFLSAILTTHEGHPKDDPRSVEELISVVLTEHDEDVAWDVLHVT
jgi:hypothetical protein